MKEGERAREGETLSSCGLSYCVHTTQCGSLYLIVRAENTREREQMTVEKLRNGAVQISDFVGEGRGEYLLTRTYYGFTTQEAKQLFIKEREGK